MRMRREANRHAYASRDLSPPHSEPDEKISPVGKIRVKLGVRLMLILGEIRVKL